MMNSLYDLDDLIFGPTDEEQEMAQEDLDDDHPLQELIRSHKTNEAAPTLPPNTSQKSPSLSEQAPKQEPAKQPVETFDWTEKESDPFMPLTFEEMNWDLPAGFAEGLISSVPGLPGDLNQLAKLGSDLALKGYRYFKGMDPPTEQELREFTPAVIKTLEEYLPTSQYIENQLFGEAENRQRQISRSIGGLFGLSKATGAKGLIRPLISATGTSLAIEGAKEAGVENPFLLMLAGIGGHQLGTQSLNLFPTHRAKNYAQTSKNPLIQKQTKDAAKSYLEEGISPTASELTASPYIQSIESMAKRKVSTKPIYEQQAMKTAEQFKGRVNALVNQDQAKLYDKIVEGGPKAAQNIENRYKRFKEIERNAWDETKKLVPTSEVAPADSLYQYLDNLKDNIIQSAPVNESQLLKYVNRLIDRIQSPKPGAREISIRDAIEDVKFLNRVGYDQVGPWLKTFRHAGNIYRDFIGHYLQQHNPAAAQYWEAARSISQNLKRNFDQGFVHHFRNAEVKSDFLKKITKPEHLESLEKTMEPQMFDTILNAKLQEMLKNPEKNLSYGRFLKDADQQLFKYIERYHLTPQQAKSVENLRNIAQSKVKTGQEFLNPSGTAQALLNDQFFQKVWEAGKAAVTLDVSKFLDIFGKVTGEKLLASLYTNDKFLNELAKIAANPKHQLNENNLRSLARIMGKAYLDVTQGKEEESPPQEKLSERTSFEEFIFD